MIVKYLVSWLNWAAVGHWVTLGERGLEGWRLNTVCGGGAVVPFCLWKGVLLKLTDNRSPSRGGGRQYCVSRKLGVCCSVKLVAWRFPLGKAQDSRPFASKMMSSSNSGGGGRGGRRVRKPDENRTKTRRKPGLLDLWETHIFPHKN